MSGLKILFDCVAVPVVGLDARLRVAFANQAARTAFSDPGHDIDFETLIFGKSGFRKLLQKTLDSGGEASTSITIKEGFGKEFLATIRAVAQPARIDGVALVVTFEDRSSLQDVKAMRSDFVANVSHEIRSPLTAISGFVETLQGTARNDPEARALFLKLMEKEVTRMTNLVRDLLSLSQVEVKERRAPRKVADPNQIIRQAVESAAAVAKKQGKTLVVQADELLPSIPGNHEDLVRVLINLLENAVNYGRAGGKVFLTAIVSERDNPLNRPAICLSVRDQGEGIPAAEIPRLTERFYRVDKSRSRNIGGTGLGLAIVKHILLRHRGLLVIESTLGEGSEFRAYLPITHADK